MKTGHVIAALRHAHPWISAERMRDLLWEAKATMPLGSTPFECGRTVLFRLDATYGTEPEQQDGWFESWNWFRK